MYPRPDPILMIRPLPWDIMWGAACGMCVECSSSSNSGGISNNSRGSKGVQRWVDQHKLSASQEFVSFAGIYRSLHEI